MTDRTHVPNELDEGVAEEAVAALLTHLGFQLAGEDLAATPARVVRSWMERLGGYEVDVEKVLSTTFSADAEDAGLVLLRGIEFHSSCEHHLLPFSGVAHVAYIPADGRVVGLSKLARTVDAYARRLQLQERMTNQIADALVEALAPTGAAVVLEGRHGCMVCRGVRQRTAVMSTSALRGVFHEDPAARSELLATISLGGPTL